MQKEVWIADLVQTFEEIWAQENQRRQKEEERGPSGYRWKIGDKVMLKELVSKGKLKPTWKGPFPVKYVASPIVVLVATPNGDVWRHSDQIKMYPSRK